MTGPCEYEQHYSEGEYWRAWPDLGEAQADFKVKYAATLIDRQRVRPALVLEIGCGPGRAASLFNVKYGCTVDAFDLNEAIVAYAREKYGSENVKFHIGEPKQISKPYDLGVLFDVFEHVEDYMSFLRRIRPMAKHWVFHIPLDMNVLSVLRGAYMGARKSLGHLHYFSAESARATLADTGYTIVDQMLTPAWRDREGVNWTWKLRLAFLPRWALSQVSDEFAAKLLGGYSLMVLTK
jgi:SAM-dependent methyltransferase